MRLPTVLTDPLRAPYGALRAILGGWALATVPALGLAALVSAIMPAAGQPNFGRVDLNIFVELVVIVPLLETLVMAAVLEGLIRLVPRGWAIGLSAVGWGIAHSLVAPAWGLVTWWIFVVLSALYLAWRKHSIGLALAIPFAVHALNNLLPALALLRIG